MRELEKFSPYLFGIGGDYLLQDDGDGEGPYVAAWHSKSPVPNSLAVKSPAEKEQIRVARKAT